MNAARLPHIKWLVRHVDSAVTRALLEDSLALRSAAAIRTQARQILHSLDYPGLEAHAED